MYNTAITSLIIMLTAAVGGSSSIKKLSGVSQSAVKRVNLVSEANIKKISGVAN